MYQQTRISKSFLWRTCILPSRYSVWSCDSSPRLVEALTQGVVLRWAIRFALLAHLSSQYLCPCSEAASGSCALVLKGTERAGMSKIVGVDLYLLVMIRATERCCRMNLTMNTLSDLYVHLIGVRAPIFILAA